MSELKVFSAGRSEPARVTRDHEEITTLLAPLGVRFERWQTEHPLATEATAEAVLAAYEPEIARIKSEFGFQSVDVVSMHPHHPDKQALREKFLDEHTHSDFEVRFFVDGAGLFYLHPNDEDVFAVLCEAGDFISVPANTRHWFDMGPNPTFKAIRFFTTPEGWVANFTGDAIASGYPRLEN